MHKTSAVVSENDCSRFEKPLRSFWKTSAVGANLERTMGKGKLAKFADMRANPLVVECPFGQLQAEGFALRGRWDADFFGNSQPIVLELGCGRGEYTVELARQFPQQNFIGIDIKGARMWHGAQLAQAEGLKNVAFLRTNIELLPQMFGPDEVAEIWLTFPDPQMKKPKKRLTGTLFLQRYRQFLADGGAVNLKTDSNFLATYTRLMAEHNGLPMSDCCTDLYATAQYAGTPLTQIQTYYEQMWLSRGCTIKYLRFALPHALPLTEPDVEIPIDDYRSYDHEVTATKKMRK